MSPVLLRQMSHFPFCRSRLGFGFPNAFRLPNGEFRDIDMDQPQTVGFGLANRRFLDGNLLLAADVDDKLRDNADFYQDFMENQWAFAVGSPLTRRRNKFRLGYSYNTNPMDHNVGDRLSHLPVAQEAIQFLQASSMALITQHRITAGVGREDFLIRGLDLDLFAGGLLDASDQFGPFQTSVAVYYVGAGITWQFGPCGATCGDGSTGVRTPASNENSSRGNWTTCLTVCVSRPASTGIQAAPSFPAWSAAG